MHYLSTHNAQLPRSTLEPLARKHRSKDKAGGVTSPHHQSIAPTTTQAAATPASRVELALVSLTKRNWSTSSQYGRESESSVKRRSTTVADRKVLESGSESGGCCFGEQFKPNRR